MMVGALAFLTGLAIAGPQPAVDAVESAEVRQCREWIQSHSQRIDRQSALVKIVSPRTLCFDGYIYSWSLKEATAWIDKFEGDGSVRPRLVVRSFGGDAAAAIDLVEKLQRRDTEVTVVDYCMSSCANYFFGGLRRRRVTPGALLLFHGGYSPGDRLVMAEWLQSYSIDPKNARHIGDPVKWKAGELKKYDSYMARQNALYRRVGVNPILVTRIPSVDEKAIPAERCGPREDASREMLFFDKRQFRRLGIVIERGEPATDPADVDRRFSKLGFSTAACAVPDTFFAGR
jgi:hypothetical protein